MSERFYEIFDLVAINIMGALLLTAVLIMGGFFTPKDKKNKKAS